MASTARVKKNQASAYPFRINPNARYSSLTPITLYDSISTHGRLGYGVEDAVVFSQPFGLDPVLFLDQAEYNPLDIYGPDMIIRYPRRPWGGDLTIEAREEEGLDPIVRPSLWFVLRLPKPTMVSKVSFMGNLLLPPAYDDRGPLTNFGLPRGLKIYAVDDWPADVWLPPPHPRDWKLLYSTRDFRGLWGWTPVTFHPAHCSHLIFVMNDLPLLYIESESKPSTYPAITSTCKEHEIHGLSIQRLAVYEYEYGLNTGSEVAFSPATSWQRTYDSNNFSSRYWSARGINPVVQDEHQSIYRELIEKYKVDVDLLPSALVGYPSYHLRDVPGTLEYETREYYSGDVTHVSANETSLVLKVIEDEIPFVEGILLVEEQPRRVDNNASTRNPDSWIRVYYTDDPDVAFSPNPQAEGWVFLTEAPFYHAFDPYGLEIEFPYEVNARFYRLVHVLDPNLAQPPRRFELKRIALQRAHNRPLVACKDEILQLNHVLIRLQGESLVDDYGYLDGKEIMDLVFETSVSGQPFRPFLSLRNLLDIREQTRSQFIANARATRAFRQQFHERTRQGDRITNQDIAILGTRARTRTKQVIDPRSLQHTLAVTEQRMLTDAATQSNDDRINRGKPAALIDNLPGITTDRNAALGDPTQVALAHLNAALNLIGDVLGINIQDMIRLLSIADDWGGANLGDAFGISGVSTLLQDLVATVNRLVNVLNNPAGAVGGAVSGGVDGIADAALDVGVAIATGGASLLFSTAPGFFPGIGIGGSFGGSITLPPADSLAPTIPDIPRLNLNPNLDLVQEFVNHFYEVNSNDLAINPGGVWDTIPYRPSVSFSGTLGGQFFGGGSAGFSLQLDAGKSTSKSRGSQGQVNETLTYYQPGNEMYTDADVESADVSRHTTRVHLHELDEEYVWKGMEVRFQGDAQDIILMTVPFQAVLRPPANGGDPADTFRIRVGYLPEGVSLDVTFVGMAFPQAPKAKSWSPGATDSEIYGKPEDISTAAESQPIDISSEPAVLSTEGSGSTTEEPAVSEPRSILRAVRRLINH